MFRKTIHTSVFLFIISFSFVLSFEDLNVERKIYNYMEKLVQFKTVSGNHEEVIRAFGWVKEELEGLPLFIEEFESNGFRSMVIKTQRGKAAKLWLVAHMDVVPAHEDLFSIKREGNLLFGRGCIDMKMAIASYLQIFKDISSSLSQYDLGIMLTSDEEIGGKNGVCHLLHREGITGDFAFLPDGAPNWQIESEAKGIVQVKIIGKGKSCHGSRPWMGKNAIGGLILFLQDLTKDFENLKEFSPDYYPTCNIGKISGGNAVNQVPDYAEAYVDIRYPSSFDKEKLMERISLLSQDHPLIIYEELISASPYKAKIDHPKVRLFENIAQDKYGIDISVTRSHGASDARFFGEAKIPVLLISPNGGDLHGEGEWVDFKDLMRFYAILKDWVSKAAKIEE